MIIVRPAAEVATKSRRTRRRFEQILRGNLEAALAAAGKTAAMRQDYGRLYVEADAQTAGDILPRLFGVGSFSCVEAEAPPDLDAIIRIGAREYGPRVLGRSYAVRAKRLSPHPFSAQTVNEQLGAALNPGARVDLDNPDVTVHVEIGRERCRFFADRRRGIGGLPIGTGGRAVVLLSGGFDSPVAAWRTMRRGVAVDYVLCNLGGKAYERQVLQAAKVLHDLWSAGQPSRLFVVDFADVLTDLRRVARPRLWQVLLKRLMYRTAVAVAQETGAEAIVTGESVGQVSSQTLSNLAAIEPASKLPVLRPLIGFDKQEIVDAAERVGTAPISRHVKEYCVIVPDRPATSSQPEHVAREEDRLDAPTLSRAISERRRIDLAGVTAADLRTPYLYKSEIPLGAEVVDCRPPHQFSVWHLTGARNMDPAKILAHPGGLDTNRTYIVMCGYGPQAAHVAERLQHNGLDAYAFQGGIAALKRHAETAGLAVTATAPPRTAPQAVG